MTYSKGSELPAPKQPDAKMKEGVQDRRCKPNVEPWRPGGRRPGHPRHRTVRHHRRPAEDRPHLAPWRPAVGIAPKLSDAELVTLAVMQALLGFPSEARWLRYARAHLGHLFPYLPKQPGYNSACAPPPRCSSSSSGPWPATPPGGPTTCGWPTPPRWSAAAPPRPSTAPSWPGGPNTATAPATRAILGAAAAPGLHPARPDADRRQELLRRCLRGGAGRPRRAAVAPGAQGRAGAGRRAPVPAVAAGDRVGQRHLQGPVGPGTPRRAHPGRRHRARAAAHPRFDRCDLAQRPHRAANPQVPPGLRSLTPLGIG